MTEPEIRTIIEKAITATGSSTSSEWDSLIHISVLIGLNQAFGGRLADVPEIQEARSIEGMVETLRKHRLIE